MYKIFNDIDPANDGVSYADMTLCMGVWTKTSAEFKAEMGIE